MRLLWINAYEWDTVLINGFWTIYNLIIISATIAVAFETKDIRKSWRVDRDIPAAVSLPSGQKINCHTDNYSLGGIALKVPEGVQFSPEQHIQLHLYRGEIEYDLPAVVVAQHDRKLRLRFEGLSLTQERNLVAATLSRADSWLNWIKVREEVDHPLRGLKELMRYSRLGLARARLGARQHSESSKS
jgi:cellulose synthase (UDP-forming)